MVRGRRGRGPPVPSVVDDLCYASPKRKDSKLEFCTKPQHSTLTTVIGTKTVNAIPTSSRDNEKNNAKVPTEFKTLTATKCQSISRFFQVKGRSLCYTNGQDVGLDVDATNDISVVDLTNEDSCDGIIDKCLEIDNMTKLTDGPSSDDTSCDSGVVVDSAVSVDNSCDATPVRTSPRKNPSTLANARLPRGPRTPHRIGQYCPSTESLDSPPVSPRSKTHLNIANGNIASDCPVQTIPRTSVRNANVRPAIALNVQCNNVVGNNDSLLVNGSSSPTSALSQLRIAFPRKNARSRRRLQSNHSENSTSMVVDRLQQQGDPMSKADVVNPALCPRQPKTLTDYFPVRRSVRKTKKAVLEERQRDIEQAIIKKQEDGLEVHNFPDKGRGIVALRKFLRGSFVLEYTGDLISLSEAKDREELYAKDENTGCYMYYFKHKNKQYCIDATPESGKLGRLVNHSRNGNLLTKTVQIGSTPHLVLIAKDDIHPGEEVCYDYGDRSKESLQHHPWLAL